MATLVYLPPLSSLHICMGYLLLSSTLDLIFTSIVEASPSCYNTIAYVKPMHTIDPSLPHSNLVNKTALVVYLGLHVEELVIMSRQQHSVPQ